MSVHIVRSCQQPKRENLSYDELWQGPDNGLIASWEVGRDKRLADPALAQKAADHELPVLGWKGGADKELKKNEKYGSLKYLAQWQGLRGEDLDIDADKEVTLTCSRTGMVVTYTADRSKYSQP